MILSDLESGKPIKIKTDRGWAICQKNKDTQGLVFCGVSPLNQNGAFGFGETVLKAISMACQILRRSPNIEENEKKASLQFEEKVERQLGSQL